MDSIRFAWSGVNMQGGAHKRENFPAARNQTYFKRGEPYETAPKEFRGIVETFSYPDNDQLKRYVIDQTIEVIDLKQDIIRAKHQFWSARKTHMLALTLFPNLVLASMVTAQIVWAVPIAGTAFLIAAIPSFLLISFFATRLRQADTELRNWKNPVEQVVKQRRQISELPPQKRLQYVIEKDLKFDCLALSNFEVRRMWDDKYNYFFSSFFYASSALENLSSEQLKAFFQDNPFWDLPWSEIHATSSEIDIRRQEHYKALETKYGVLYDMDKKCHAYAEKEAELKEEVLAFLKSIPERM